ncbi:hypothetical protein VTH82DRAFT_2456 [Thermothelomyces myriococcoides]
MDHELTASQLECSSQIRLQDRQHSRSTSMATALQDGPSPPLSPHTPPTTNRCHLPPSGRCRAHRIPSTTCRALKSIPALILPAALPDLKRTAREVLSVSDPCHPTAAASGPALPAVVVRCRASRVWEVAGDAQAAAGYRRPSPGPGGQWQQPPHGQHDPRYGDHGRGRLQKPNPNLQPTAQGGPPMGGGQPGRDYGRPVSDNYGAAPGGYDRYGPAPPGSPGRPPTGGPGSPGLHPSHAGPSARPVSHVDPGSGGRSSAPPAGANGRPGPPSSTASSPGPAANQQRPPPPSTRPSGASSTNLVHPDGKTMGNGPATFEEMGIPQGKNENDCVVM